MIGTGGREHALALALSRDPGVTEVHAAPGNPGIAAVATLHPVDPMSVWKGSRDFVAGWLEVTTAEDDHEADGDVVVFDPTRVVDGIELSDDPILHVRSHAYSVSIERRSGVPRPA